MSKQIVTTINGYMGEVDAAIREGYRVACATITPGGYLLILMEKAA